MKLKNHAMPSGAFKSFMCVILILLWIDWIVTLLIKGNNFIGGKGRHGKWAEIVLKNFPFNILVAGNFRQRL